MSLPNVLETGALVNELGHGIPLGAFLLSGKLQPLGHVNIPGDNVATL